ncbi:MAG: hypothetical protein KAY65_17255 [Planctomycetes bacterium]|nr:hypothetical protein [Planctomycetota bacterium]
MQKNVVTQGMRKIGCLLLVAVMLVGCGARTEQQSNSKQALSAKDEKAVISASVRKALAEFNQGAALLEQYKYTEAAKAFEAVLDVVPDWNALRRCIRPIVRILMLRTNTQRSF